MMSMVGIHGYSQLSSCRVQTCLSMGYLVRSMLQAIVAVMLQRIHCKNIANHQKHHFCSDAGQVNKKVAAPEQQQQTRRLISEESTSSIM